MEVRDFIDLKKVRFGSPAAERDPGLYEYFVESDAYRRVAEGTKRIVIGNRGAGKSAIFQVMASRERRQSNTSVIELSPEDYSYELLKETMVSELDGSWRKESAYAAAWKYLIYVLVMKALTRDGDRGSKSSSLGKIARYVRDNHAGGQNDKFSALISYLKRLEGVKVGPYEAGMKVRELQKLYKLEEVTDLIPNLRDVLDRHRVVIFVDELDRGWDESEDAKAFVAGLFQACITLNSLHPNLRLYMSLRQELYENIPAIYDDAQKVRDLTEYVKWDEVGLQRLMNQRIRFTLSESLHGHAQPELQALPDELMWSLIFSETLTYRQSNSFNYLIDRTLYRPREIIQFATQIVEQALTEARGAPLDYASIVVAEHSYSEERAQDIAAEYRFQFADLLAVFEAFRGRTFTFDRDELEDLCLEILVEDKPSSVDHRWMDGYDPEHLIEVLWRVGFLKAQAVGGIKGRARSGSTYLGPYQAGSLNLGSISRFQVHPMYRSWLAMREPKGDNTSTARKPRGDSA
ncbi:hypothetical protein ABXJ56_13460 [Microbacterium chocolatum]|uniref:P-loop ATPase, Sll1717 family n=1 Tax=Microbacterium aurantiacum TaxID=162393 RepID=UPI00338E55A4